MRIWYFANQFVYKDGPAKDKNRRDSYLQEKDK